MIATTRDITSRKLAEIQLRENQKNLSLIAEQTVNAIIITDSSGRIVWVNAAFTQFTEYHAEEVVGKKPSDLRECKETDNTTINYLREKINNKQLFDCEILNYSKSGRKYWAHFQGQPLFDEYSNCGQYFAILTDITNNVLLDQQLSKERHAKQKEITDAVLN
jgi:PAS domain S-box-containing protein